MQSGGNESWIDRRKRITRYYNQNRRCHACPLHDGENRRANGKRHGWWRGEEWIPSKPKYKK